MNYWKKCMEKYTEHLEANGDLDTLPLTKLAIDNTESLISKLE